MPNLYSLAADVITKANDKKGSVKSLVIAAKWKNTKQLFALVVETLKYYDVLEEIMTKTKFLQTTKKMPKTVAAVLIYDFLFGKGLQCGGKYKSAIFSHKSQLKSALAMLKVKRKVQSNKELLRQEVKDAKKLPKYIRVNTLMANFKSIIEVFKRDNFILVNKPYNEIQKTEFAVDKDVENLLVFHPDVDFHDHRLYKSGEMIFQDKASCLPAIVLNAKKGSDIIDACAAPGNKTSHLASLMGNLGNIFAFDKSAHRLSTMNSMLLKAGVLCVKTICSDFLKVAPNDSNYVDVKYILLDPSCSGSGIVNRYDALLNQANDNVDNERLENLANFQKTVLLHAMSFPAVEKIVYSTCSIHDKENEEVVQHALKENKDFELVDALPSWKNRGKIIKGFKEGNKCIRCSPENNNTNGFFIALFVKKCLPLNLRTM